MIKDRILIPVDLVDENGKAIKDKDGNFVQTFKLNPTPKMRFFAFCMCFDEEFSGMNPEEVLDEIGLGKGILAKWRKEFNPYFDEWLEDFYHAPRKKNVKRMLRFVGLDRAFAGDFPFWKEMSKAEGLIKADEVNHNIIPANLGSGFDDWDSEQVEKHRNSLLQAIRGVEHKGGPDLVEGFDGGGSESNSRGTPSVLEESVALAESVGPNGERSIEEPLSDF